MQGVSSLYVSKINGLIMEQLNEERNTLAGIDIMSVIMIICVDIHLLSIKKGLITV